MEHRRRFQDPRGPDRRLLLEGARLLRALLSVPRPQVRIIRGSPTEEERAAELKDAAFQAFMRRALGIHDA
jgi:hypothetical protein